MRALMTALRGLWKGVMALLAGIWAMMCWYARCFHPKAERRVKSPPLNIWHKISGMALLFAIMFWPPFGVEGLAGWQHGLVAFGAVGCYLTLLSYAIHVGLVHRLRRFVGDVVGLPLLAALIVMAVAVSVLMLMAPRH